MFQKVQIPKKSSSLLITFVSYIIVAIWRHWTSCNNNFLKREILEGVLTFPDVCMCIYLNLPFHQNLIKWVKKNSSGWNLEQLLRSSRNSTQQLLISVWVPGHLGRKTQEQQALNKARCQDSRQTRKQDGGKEPELKSLGVKSRPESRAKTRSRLQNTPESFPLLN